MAHSGRAQSSRTLKISPRVPLEEVPRGRPGDWLSREDGKHEKGLMDYIYTSVSGACSMLYEWSTIKLYICW